LRRQANRLAGVGNSLGELLLVGVHEAPADVGADTFRIETQRLGVVGKGLVETPLLVVGIGSVRISLDTFRTVFDGPRQGLDRRVILLQFVMALAEQQINVMAEFRRLIQGIELRGLGEISNRVLELTDEAVAAAALKIQPRPKNLWVHFEPFRALQRLPGLLLP
jgi:hypothetical protein